MTDRITEFQINQISHQIERLGKAIDKICDRLIRLEEDLVERTFKKKMMNFLFVLYPVVMLLLVMITNSDHQKISEAYIASKPIMDAISEVKL